MFENIGHFFKRIVKTEQQKELGSKDAAKERLHLVLMQDRANVSADFLELMKQEIIDVIKKYIVVDENLIDVRLTNQENEDGTNGAPSLYANIPIVNIKNDMMAEKIKSFEGVDFNKEMGIPMKKESTVKLENEEEANIPPVINLSSTQDKIDEDYEDEEMFEEIDDDDDDVTFDDLLKAAEAEEEMKKKAQSKEKQKSDLNDLNDKENDLEIKENQENQENIENEEKIENKNNSKVNSSRKENKQKTKKKN